MSVFFTALAKPRRPTVIAPGLLYHVIVRGNQRRKTYRCDDDYKAYLDRLELFQLVNNVPYYVVEKIGRAPVGGE